MSYTELSRSNPKAQKKYNCEWCSEIIEIGEVHFKRNYIYDGQLQSGRMHNECFESMNNYPTQDDLIDGWLPGDFKRGQKWK